MLNRIGSVIIALGLLPAAHATWTLVQHSTPFFSCDGNGKCTLYQATGPGHLVVVMEAYQKSSSIKITQVNGGGSYEIPTGCAGFSNTGPLAVGTNCAFTRSSTATSTITVMHSTSDPEISGYAIDEYSSTLSIALDGTPGTVIDSPQCTSCSGVGLTITGNDVIIQSFATTGTAAGISSPYDAAFGGIDVDSNGNGYATLLNTATGKAPTWSQDTNVIGVGCAIAFKEL